MKHIALWAVAVVIVGCLYVSSVEAYVERDASFFNTLSSLVEVGSGRIKSIEVIPGDEDSHKINFLIKFRGAAEPIAFWGSDSDGSDTFSLDGIDIFGRYDRADSEFRLVLDMRIIGANKTPLKLYIGYDNQENMRYRVEEFIVRRGPTSGSWDIEKTGEVYDLPYGE